MRHLCYCTQEFVELKVVDVHLPIESYDALVKNVESSITKNTRLAVLDHIASSTGFVLPLKQLISMFHARNIPVLVDGASAPGQLPLSLRNIGADFYVGTCYKWLFGSKSCSFLYVSKDFQVSFDSIWIIYSHCGLTFMINVEHSTTRRDILRIWARIYRRLCNPRYP